jgi:hypothetical protein
MSKVYSNNELEGMFYEYINEKGTNLLYNSNFINWKGITKEEINYAEFISKLIIDNSLILGNEIAKIDKVNRESYIINTKSHQNKKKVWARDNSPWNKQRRKEEHIVFALHDQNYIFSFGRIVDYQIPIKSNKDDQCGKIDFIGIDYNNGIVNLCEIKNDKSEETLLRAVLEISTYYQQLNMEKFKSEVCSEIARPLIKKVVVIFKGTTPYYQYCNLDKMPNLREIIERLEVKIIILEYDEDKTRFLEIKDN